MVWCFYLIIAGFLIYAIYNIYALKCFGIPHSLSTTYYLFKEKKEWMRLLFPIMMISMAVLMMPAWITLSIGSNFQFTAFLSLMGIIFTGACPTFESSKHEDRLHSISACFSALMAILWMIFVGNTISVLFIVTALLLILAFITEQWNEKLTYWFETAVFLSIFISLFILIF